MMKCSVLVTFLWSVLAVCVADIDNGYIFTCPRSLKTGVINEMQLRRYGKLDPGTLKVTVYYSESYSENETIGKEQEYEIGDGEQYSALKLFLPANDNSVYAGRVAINGTFADNHIIEGSDKVHFSSAKEDITIIQTDKPIYKPGQTVQFRILKMNNELKPKGNVEADVWVEDPSGARLFQWKGVPLGVGIKQLEFLLSEEPTQGNWKISVFSNGETDSTTFEVKEYVLPKFEVDISVPSYVLADAETIPIKICAKYTYGKKVRGSLNMNVSLETYAWTNEKYPQLNTIDEIDGCYNYSINVSLIEKGDYYRYRRISIITTVMEKGTGVQRNATEYIQRQYAPLNLNFNQEGTKQYFKPGIPYSGKLKVTHPDNSPAEGEPIELCATESRERVLGDWWASKKVKICRNFTSNAEGIVEFITVPQKTDSVGLLLEAKSLRYGNNRRGSTHRQNVLTRPDSSMSLTPFFSPSGSFIHIQESNILSCGVKKNVTILFTAKEDSKFKFFYQVISRGKVARTGSIDTTFSIKDDVSSQYQDENKLIKGEEIKILPAQSSSSKASTSKSEEECASEREARYVPYVGRATIDIDVDSSLSPSSIILVYYVRDDRETIADSQKLKVEKCFNNEVKMTFGDEVKQPGTNTVVQVKAAPNSLCGIKVVDKSITLLDSSDQLTATRVFSLLENMDTGFYYSNDPCNDNMPQPGLYRSSSSSIARPPRPWATSSYEDSLAAFLNSGYLVISDLVVITRPCQNNNRGSGYGEDYNFQSNDEHDTYQDSIVPVQAFAISATRPRPPPPPARTTSVPKKALAATKSVVDVRTYFPDTWLFQAQMTGPDGIYIAKEKLPHTITEWIGNAVCINAEDGFGISNTASMKGFQAFFISFTLPYSVIRGESFWITVSIFNYVQDSLPITVSLENAEGFVVTSDSINGDICVEPGASHNLKIQLKATHLGKVNITVRAETSHSSDICGSSSVSDAVAKDAVTNSLVVESEGWPVENVESILFCPSDELNEVFVKNFDLSLPDDVVPDSARAIIDFTGNIMGPSMDNLENLVTLPTGCGEQNMVKFVPNFVVLEYLSEVKQLNDKIKARAVRNLNTGAQRQMNYRHLDGSFSAFGATDKEGSMFLTAFVLRYFSQAQKYITIDNRTISDMQVWITSKQLPDGCFPEIGRLFDSGLQGGIEREKNQGSITAYVLSSLIISGFKNQTVIDSALACMKQDSNRMSPYSTFLYAYAQALAGEKDSAKEKIAEVRKGANETGGVEYYKNINGSQSKNLETAAYAVLAVLETGGGASDVLSIVRFMTMNLSPRGGFISTQDTCVGLEALAGFAKLLFKNTVDIKIVTTGILEENVAITEEDKMLVKRYRISDVPSEVKVEATGSGCALLQKTLRYNSNTPPQKKQFNLNVIGECIDPSCNHGNINVSVSYIPEGKKSSMSVIEVKMISGMVPSEESLEKITQDTKLELTRFDVENNVVVLYFYEISNAAKQLSFKVDKIIEVENAQNGTAKVYEYYAKENSASVSYMIHTCKDSSSCHQEE